MKNKAQLIAAAAATAALTALINTDLKASAQDLVISIDDRPLPSLGESDIVIPIGPVGDPIVIPVIPIGPGNPGTSLPIPTEPPTEPSPVAQPPQQVPEPSSAIALGVLGLGAVASRLRRRSK